MITVAGLPSALRRAAYSSAGHDPRGAPAGNRSNTFARIAADTSIGWTPVVGSAPAPDRRDHVRSPGAPRPGAPRPGSAPIAVARIPVHPARADEVARPDPVHRAGSGGLR